MVYEDFIWWDVRGQYTSPVASAIVYKEGDYAIAKVWSNERWKRVARGLNHANVFQQALNEIAEYGGGLIVLNGEFSISETSIYLPSDVPIYLMGFGAKITWLEPYYKFTPASGASKVEIHVIGIKFDLNNTGLRAFDFGDFEVTGSIIQNEFVNVPNNGAAISGRNMKYMEIAFNRFHKPAVTSGDLLGYGGQYIHIHHNIFERKQAGTGTASYVDIHDNIFWSDDLTYGVLIEQAYDTDMDYFNIHHNIFINSYLAHTSSTETTGITRKLKIYENMFIGRGINIDGGNRYVEDVEIVGNTIVDPWAEGIFLRYVKDATVEDNTIINSNISNSSDYVLKSCINLRFIDGVVKVARNRMKRTAALDYDTPYGVTVTGGAEANSKVLIYDNVFNSMRLAPVYIESGLKSYVIANRNYGYLTENSGTATITAGSTSVTVNHGLVDTPSKVHVTPLSDPGTYWYVTNITSTSFDIVLASAPSSDVIFSWYAEV